MYRRLVPRMVAARQQSRKQSYNRQPHTLSDTTGFQGSRDRGGSRRELPAAPGRTPFVREIRGGANDRDGAGPATNSGGAGGRLSPAGAALDAGSATPNSTAVARYPRAAATEPTTQSRRSCGPAF